MEPQATSLLGALRKDLRDQMNDLADTLATNGAKSFEDYRHLTGIIAGLARAERALLDLNDRIAGAQQEDDHADF